MSRLSSILLLTLLSGCAPSVSGVLRGPNDEVITGEDAKVNIMALNSEGSEESAMVVDVDSDGEFSSSGGLKKGAYLVEALVPGYQVASEKINLDSSLTLKLTLKPLAKSKDPSAVGANPNLDMSRGGGGVTLTPPQL